MGDEGVPRWAITLHLSAGGYINLSFLTNDFDRYDKALAIICDATKIKRFDP